MLLLNAIGRLVNIEIRIAAELMTWSSIFLWRIGGPGKPMAYWRLLEDSGPRYFPSSGACLDSFSVPLELSITQGRTKSD
jgi:hypothetical protein